MALVKVNDCDVLYMKPSTDPNYPSLVLCYDPSAKTKKYAVWFADDYGVTISGNFQPTFQKAKDYFDSRPEGEPPAE